MDALAVILPLASTALGAGITYIVNVRQRRRSYVEDIINEAIAAVTAAEVSVDYLASAGRPQYMRDEDFAAFQSWLVLDGMKSWATNVKDANRALARVVPYQPALAPLLPFQPDAAHRGTDQAILSVLRAVRSPRNPEEGESADRRRR